MQACLDKVANSYAEGFAASAARYIFKLDSSEVISKLHKVYRQAANLSYNLWTRKITTLEGPNKLFDGKDPKTILHTSVTEDNEDKLTGQAITIVVHPQVEAYGTEQAEHFDRSREYGGQLRYGCTTLRHASLEFVGRNHYAGRGWKWKDNTEQKRWYSCLT
ncbi:hypothetical protein OCU04_003190 [Sclerotinia nivalis]|uniref:Uncharacterized protein n=1 Tax=Sclerotinia nivalis TaxID=352851 RepID=A0A9X0DPA9_9HELO|nr:hypothetical protein OCU04_003190 [Sclerotinia nivalis]